MKKIDKVSVAFCFFLIVAILIIGYGLVIAAPFIISDPQPEAVKFRMRLCDPNGANCSSWVESNPVNGGMMFDIAGVPKAAYKGEAQAYGVTDSLTDVQTGQVSTISDWSPSAFFVLTRGIIVPPKIYKINP
jgi:hypothetical protein